MSLPGDASACSELDTPVAVVDMDLVEKNARSMAEFMTSRGISLRPHAKTHKSVEIARVQVAAGARGLTVATLGEAAVFADHGFDDLFVAYPLWISAAKATRLAALHERVRSLAVGADSVEAVHALARAVRGARTPLPVLIEIDSGGRRSGVEPSYAVKVAEEARNVGLEVRGIFTHGGHGYGGPRARRGAGQDEVAQLASAAGLLAAAGFGHGPGGLVVSAGSTPTAEMSAVGPVTEERPGTYVFGDRTQALLGSCAWEDIALVVASTVVSVSVQGSETQFVLDAGSKILSSDRQDWVTGFGHVVEYPQAEVEHLYEHHAVCKMSKGLEPPRVGSVLRVVPNHVCMVPNAVDEMVVFRAGRPTGECLTVDARGKF